MIRDSRITRFGMLAVAFAVASTLSAAEFKPVFTDDFAGDAKPQWSEKTISVTPQGSRRFLGEFGRQSVKLQLPDLPAHKLVRVSFDLLALRSWDGNSPGYGPDILNLIAEDGRVVFRSTFGLTHSQSFPGVYGVHWSKAYTGAIEKDTLGYHYCPVTSRTMTTG